MTNAQLYQAIFHRKSIRKFDMKLLPQDTISKLQEYVSRLKPLDNNIHYEIDYLETDDVKNLLPIKAPHYICLYSQKVDNYLMNAGFLLQQIDLYFSVNNVGSCWVGMARPSKGVPLVKNGLDFVIMLAFGNTSERIHRADSSEFKRNRLTEISDIKGAEEILEAVRLAPSASNSQPWFFSGDIDEITVSRKKLGILRAPLYEKMNQIDIGIALCHLWLSFDQHGTGISYDFREAAAPSGYEFMVEVNKK